MQEKTLTPLKEHCEQCNQPLWVTNHNHRSCDVLGLSEPFFWPIFPCSALDKVIAMCYDQYSTSQYPRGRESRPQVEKGTLQVGMRLSPIKVPTGQKLYMVS